MIFGMPTAKFAEVVILAILFPAPLIMVGLFRAELEPFKLLRQILVCVVLGSCGAILCIQIILCATDGVVSIHRSVLFWVMISEFLTSLLVLFLLASRASRKINKAASQS